MSTLTMDAAVHPLFVDGRPEYHPKVRKSKYEMNSDDEGYGDGADLSDSDGDGVGNIGMGMGMDDDDNSMAEMEMGDRDSTDNMGMGHGPSMASASQSSSHAKCHTKTPNPNAKGKRTANFRDFFFGLFHTSANTQPQKDKSLILTTSSRRQLKTTKVLRFDVTNSSKN